MRRLLKLTLLGLGLGAFAGLVRRRPVPDSVRQADIGAGQG